MQSVSTQLFLANGKMFAVHASVAMRVFGNHALELTLLVSM